MSSKTGHSIKIKHNDNLSLWMIVTIALLAVLIAGRVFAADAVVASQDPGLPLWAVLAIATIVVFLLGAGAKGLLVLSSMTSNKWLKMGLELAAKYAIPVIQVVWAEFAKEAKAKAADGKLSGPEAKEAARRALAKLKEALGADVLSKIRAAGGDTDTLLSGVIEEQLLKLKESKRKGRSITLDTAVERNKTVAK